MNADDTPTTPDDAVERFAAAVDGGPTPRPGHRDGADLHGAADAGDPELARELEIVDLLTAQRSTWDPDADTRARARRRLLAALAEDLPRAAGNGPSRAS